MLLGEVPNDFDLYSKTKAFAEAIARHYVERFVKFHPSGEIVPQVRVEGERVRIHIQSAGVASETADEGYRYFEELPEEQAEAYVDKLTADPEAKQEEPQDKDPFRPRFLSENAISLSDKVQVVIRFWGDLEEIHRNYDFDHCRCGYDYQEDELHLPTEALTSLMSRTLRYSGSLYPLCSLFRMRKFVQRGWHISAGEILKIAFQVSELDMQDELVLREQLVGVDMAYFFELLQIIATEKESRGEKPLDSTYLAQLIDRVFNA